MWSKNSNAHDVIHHTTVNFHQKKIYLKYQIDFKIEIMLIYYDKSATRNEQHHHHHQNDIKCPLLGYDSVNYRCWLHTFRRKLLAVLLTSSVRAQPVSSTY